MHGVIMNNKLQTLILSIGLSSLAGITFAEATDSTMITASNVKPAVSAYLLERGIAQTFRDSGEYTVNVKVKSRCDALTTPVLNTSVKSVEVYGKAQAIQGLNNTLALDPNTYVISGSLSAPLNVSGWDSGATVNWQVWCQPKQTA